MKILASVCFKDRFDEMRVLSALRGLDPATYLHFKDLDLPHRTERGTTRIEHVVVSHFGIFVIETTNRRSWNFGIEHEPEWLQRIDLRRSRCQNSINRKATEKPQLHALHVRHAA